MVELRIGTAGWGINKSQAPDFPGEGSQLTRYAARLNAVEINSSFYRPHRPDTYARWAESVPTGFRFAVKLPKAITHEAKLRDCEALLERFAEETACLGEKRGPLLVQLPPSLRFDPAVADRFFTAARAALGDLLVCEPRHASWFTGEAEALLTARHVARVAADPAPVPAAAEPAGWQGLAYWRLHGSPRVYYSPYEEQALAAVAARLLDAARRGASAWCILDNTALGHALGDAVTVARMTRPTSA